MRNIFSSRIGLRRPDLFGAGIVRPSVYEKARQEVKGIHWPFFEPLSTVSIGCRLSTFTDWPSSLSTSFTIRLYGLSPLKAGAMINSSKNGKWRTVRMNSHPFKGMGYGRNCALSSHLQGHVLQAIFMALTSLSA
jgi:hypothetical protein